MDIIQLAVKADEVKKAAEKVIEAANVNVNVNVNAAGAAPAADGASGAVNAATNAADAAQATFASDLLSNFDLSNPNWDLFILMFFLVVTLLYGMSLGRDRIIVILVSIYMSLAIVNYLPPLEVQLNNSFPVQIGAFIGLFVALFFLLSRSALLRTFGRNTASGSWLQVMLFSFLHVGLLISITLSYLPPEWAANFSPLIRNAFTGQWPQFAWICAPIIAMVMLKGGGSGGRPRNDFDY